MLKLQLRSGFPERYCGQFKKYVFEIGLKDGSTCRAIIDRDPDTQKLIWKNLSTGKFIPDVIPEDTVVGWRETYNCDAALRDIMSYFGNPGSIVAKDRLSDAFTRHIEREGCSDCRSYYEKKSQGPESKKMPEIDKELLCSVGQDWNSKNIFIGKLNGLDSEVAYLVAKELHLSPENLHNLTCVIKDFSKISGITGAGYLVSKVLKLKIKVVIEECKLVDDVAAES